MSMLLSKRRSLAWHASRRMRKVPPASRRSRRDIWNGAGSVVSPRCQKLNSAGPSLNSSLELAFGSKTRMAA
jgi:hypothetical protein